MERKYYLDNLRWLAILLLFPYHTAQIWSGGEYSGFYVWSHTNNGLFAFSNAIFPWYMAILFAIAGISSTYALKKRTYGQFVKERIQKLLIPFIFGVLVLVPIMTYVAEIFFNGYTGSYFEQYILFFTKETDLTGYSGGFTPAHLWFLLYLFVISLVSLIIINLQQKFFPKFRIEKLSYLSISILFIPSFIALFVLNFSGKSVGLFLLLYMFGYYILSEEKVLQTIKQYRYLSLILAMITGSISTYMYCFRDIKSLWLIFLFVFYGWMGILTLLGFGQTQLNFTNKVTQYFTRSSFSIYILHQPVLVVVGFFVLKLSIGMVWQFILIMTISFVLTILLCEIVKRIPLLNKII